MNALDEVYTDRAHLVAVLAADYPSVRIPAPDVEEPGWWIVYIYFLSQQLSWHIAPPDMHLFVNVPVVSVDDWRAKWDGHTTAQKHTRIRQGLGLAV